MRAGIYPLQNVYIRKVKVLKAPKFDLTKLMEVSSAMSTVSVEAGGGYELWQGRRDDGVKGKAEAKDRRGPTGSQAEAWRKGRGGRRAASGGGDAAEVTQARCLHRG